MGAFTGRYEFTAQGRPCGSGPCEFSFDADTATVASDGPPIAFDLGNIEALAIGEYELALSLYDGSVLRLTHFARAFQTLVSELRDAHRARLVTCLLVSDLDEVARFDASIDATRLPRPSQGHGEVRLYESNVAFLLDGGGGFQWRLSDIERVSLDERDYVVSLATNEGVVRVGKLAKRTSELVARLNDRMLALKERSGRALHAVLPFLTAAEFQRVASELREGCCAPLSTLRAIHPRIEASLFDGVVDADLRPYVADLARRSGGAGYVGWKIVRRESRDADPAGDDASPLPVAEPDEDAVDDSRAAARQTESPSEGPLLDVGEGLEALFWFFFPIGAATGEPTHVAWEATSLQGRATYLFQVPGGGGEPAALDAAIQVMNRGLVALTFRRAPIYLADETLLADSRYRHYAIATRRVPELCEVRQWFAGRAIHTSVAGWGRQVERVLAAAGAD